MREIKKVGEFYVNSLGLKFKTREAAKYINIGECWLYNSGRGDLYDWNERYLMMMKGLGYIKWAAELEPYNPDVIWYDGWYTDLTHKSNEYMLNLTKDLLTRCKKSVENGYDVMDARNLRVLKWSLGEFKRKIKKGILMDGKW